MSIQTYIRPYAKLLHADGSYSVAKRFHTSFDGPIVPVHLDNLIRLGILEIPAMKIIADEKVYEPLEADKALEPLFAEIVDSGKQVDFERVLVRLTNFGGQFVQQVVKDKA
ncbi:hypothetical protein BEL04_08235 [Mucilaginibacter sp. PPCGB 2223]|uniref:Abi-alpha family protein n=1 Tax=Mucilaginibacter sp. PPCGB 2223 TaxID=1886027 RepID=UPI0008263994|nr:Abi-alpha family protein [Mucilaginibacter sp. PPCGB 2223]OCX54235.1 hypothetical protein BEL04_08235 [Mucilaginibacter sp. PPCGB 2223]